ncbi:MAG: FAD-dependent oxidoreductase, partial [Sedimentisphaerales bacterium]|nr:FAD-dependent oxidoreductase [Sedimentisphaerales bacterium]
TLIAAIGERPDSDCLAPMGLEVTKNGTLRVDAETLATNRPGVFAGGDLITGPNTVVDAIAAGKKAAAVIDRYLRGELSPGHWPGYPRREAGANIPAKAGPEVKLPKFFIEPAAVSDEESQEAARVEPTTLPVESRRKNFAEVETALSVEAATREARRCLRCDLEFTRPKQNEEAECAAVEGKSV